MGLMAFSDDMVASVYDDSVCPCSAPRDLGSLRLSRVIGIFGKLIFPAGRLAA